MAKKDISINELAEMVKCGFDKTATKEELNDMHKDLSHRIDGLELKMTAYVGSTAQEFKKLHDWVKDIDERLTVVEKIK